MSTTTAPTATCSGSTGCAGAVPAAPRTRRCGGSSPGRRNSAAPGSRTGRGTSPPAVLSAGRTAMGPPHRFHARAYGTRPMAGSMWAATLPEAMRVTGEPLARRHRRGRRRGRRRLHRPLDRLLPRACRSALRVAVLERDVVGFGASGRNGGWCSALLAAGIGTIARRNGREAATAMQQAMYATVDEVGRVVADEGFDCPLTKGGTITLARTEAQETRLLAELDEARSFGFGDEHLRRLVVRRGRAAVPRHRHPDGRLHARLRGHPSAAPRPRARRGGAAPRGAHPRAHAGHRDRAAAGSRRLEAWCGPT